MEGDGWLYLSIMIDKLLKQIFQRPTTLGQFLLWGWSSFLVHAVLRLFVLGRDNAYGAPLVNKLDWYIFHAFAIDFLWIMEFALICYCLQLALDSILNTQRTYLLKFFILSQLLLFPLTVLDHETMRFMGGHLTKNLLMTYGNASSIRELLVLIGDDLSIPYLPIVLFFGSIPLVLILRQLGKTQIQQQPYKWLKVSLVLALVFFLYKDVFWKGGFREKRLMAFHQLAFKELTYDEVKLSPSQYRSLALTFQKQWQSEAQDTSWVFPYLDFPLFKMTPHEFCQIKNNPASEKLQINPDLIQSIDCQRDSDGDGYPLIQDCVDSDSLVHPQAEDIPSNGVDEDCSGIDSKPWNIAVFILESHRARHAGFLKEYGASRTATPFLDSLVRQPAGRYWSHLNTSGLPTIGAFSAIHLGLWDNSIGHTAVVYNGLESRSYVDHLKLKGYQAEFFSSADPAWDNQSAWLSKWYGGFHYDRNLEEDAKMFNSMGAWMKSNLKEPFVVGSITKTNHYPFNFVEGVQGDESADLPEKMSSTMKYTEESLRSLFDLIQDEPWFKRTLFVFVADHGFSLGEHDIGGVVGGMYRENTWIPMVTYGAHPQLMKLSQDSSVFHQSRSQVDIAPTILDLVGLRASNHFGGHSLLRPRRAGSEVYLPRANQGFVADDQYRYYCDGPTARSLGHEAFALSDFQELHNLKDSLGLRYQEACQKVRQIDSLNLEIHRTNTLMPGLK